MTAPLPPHGDQPVVEAGPPPARAAAGLILVHGRGATAESILTLERELGRDDLACRAPQAAGRSWYPASFLAPIAANQPGLDSGLTKLEAVVAELEDAGLPARRIAVLGFSQGACLAAEFIARHPRRYGGAILFTGGLAGPRGTPRNDIGDLAGTPVFLGAGDPDPHVPWWRVEETAQGLTAMGAEVTVRRYPGMPHTINEEELGFARRILEQAAGEGAGRT